MKFIVQITILLFLLSSCANMVAPTGGEKDITVPKLINTTEVYSKENNQIEEILELTHQLFKDTLISLV